MKLQYKTALIIFGFGTFFIAAISSVSYFYKRSEYISQLKSELQDAAGDKAAHIEVNLKGKADVASMITHVPMVVKALEDSNSEFAAIPENERDEEIKILNEKWMKAASASDPFVSPYMTNPVARYLKEHMDRNPGKYGEIFLTNRYGTIIATTGKLTTLAHSHKYWWRASFNDGKGRLFFDDRGFDTSVEGYVLGVVVPVIKNGEIIGILKCNVSIEDILQSLVEGFDLGKSGRLKIARSGGLIVLEKGKNPLSTKAPTVIIEEMKKREAGSLIIEDGGVTLLSAYSPISITAGTAEYGFGGKHESIDHIMGNKGELWYVSISQEMNEALAPLFERIRGNMLAGLALICILGLFSLLIGRRLALPIMRMEKLAKKVGEGDFDVEMDVRSEDELGRLAEAFNTMTLNLRKTVDDLSNEIKERKKTGRELRKSNRIKDLFADIMRHDLLNPANVMLNSAEILYKKERSSKKREIIELIRDSTSRFVEMIENASTYSRLGIMEELDRDMYDLGKIISEIIHDFSFNLKEKKMKIKFKQEKPHPANLNVIVKDVFSNIISNAIKYSPDRSVINVHIDERGGNWLVSVIDEGDGILDKNKEQIFERFERVAMGGVKGSGLGLAIARRIVELHKGKIWVEDNPEGGSIFITSLPKT